MVDNISVYIFFKYNLTEALPNIYESRRLAVLGLPPMRQGGQDEDEEDFVAFVPFDFLCPNQERK